MRKLLFILALAFASTLGWAQGGCVSSQALTARQGFSNLAAVVPSATVSVSPGPIYTDNTLTTVIAGNVVTADQYGNYSVCFAPGMQVLTVNGPNMQTLVYRATVGVVPNSAVIWTQAQTFAGISVTSFSDSGPFTASGSSLFTNGLQVDVAGTGCGQALYLLNTEASPTSPNKYIRINKTTGALEIMNSTCTTAIYSFGDTGSLTTTNSVIAPSVLATTFNTGVAGGTVPTPYLVNGNTTIYFVCSGGGTGCAGTPGDWTDASSTSLQNIPGLALQFAGSVAPQTVPFSCHLIYNQTVAAVSDTFGIVSSVVAPTNIAVTSTVQTAATTNVYNDLPVLNTTTPTAFITFTPSAITSTWNADFNGFIELPTFGSNPVVQIQVSQSTAGDLLVIKRGSWCRIY